MSVYCRRRATRGYGKRLTVRQLAAVLLCRHLLADTAHDRRHRSRRKGFHPSITLAPSPHSGRAFAQARKELCCHTVVGCMASQAAIAANTLHHLYLDSEELEGGSGSLGTRWRLRGGRER
jgi:hypothetical protein